MQCLCVKSWYAWTHECMMENLFDFSISYFFFLSFLFLPFFGVNLFSLKSSNPCLFHISFFLLLIFYFQHFISEKWGYHKFWSPISKSCLYAWPFLFQHWCTHVWLWIGEKREGYVKKKMGRDWDNLVYVASHNLLLEVNLMNICETTRLPQFWCMGKGSMNVMVRN